MYVHPRLVYPNYHNPVPNPKLVPSLPNSVFLIWTSTVLVVDQPGESVSKNVKDGSYIPEQEEMKDDNDGGNAEPEKRMKTSQSSTSSV
jgi:hypothetical protein